MIFTRGTYGNRELITEKKRNQLELGMRELEKILRRRGFDANEAKTLVKDKKKRKECSSFFLNKLNKYH